MTTPATPNSGRPAGPWPLTGRFAELEALGRAQRDPACGGVVLSGPAGVGKTRLAEAALAEAEAAGRPTARVVGHATTRAIPLGAVAHLLGADLIAGLGVGAAPHERHALFHQALQELQRRSGGERLVLLVDDLDLLDDTSTALLVTLVVARAAVVVATVRTGRSPEAPLAQLQRDGHLVRVDVPPLDGEALAALLEGALGAPLAAPALQRLARLADGDLRVLAELVRGALDDGALARRGGSWELVGEPPTSATLHELVAENLERVDEAGREALEALAACPELGLPDAEALLGAATLEELEADGLVVVAGSGHRLAVRLAHPLHGEVLRQATPLLRRRRIRRQLAATIERHGARRREDQLWVALWRLDSGDQVDPAQRLGAARLALLGHDPALATRLAEPPLPADADASTRGERLLVLAEAATRSGRRDEVERLVAEAEPLDLPDDLRAELVSRLSGTRFMAGQDLDGALAACDAGLARLRGPGARARIEARRAALLASAGRPGEALRAIGRLPAELDERAAAEVAPARVNALMLVGRCDRAAALARAAAGGEGSFGRHLLDEAHALGYSGRYAASRALLEPAAARALAAGARASWVWFEMALGEVARDTGRGEEAVRRCQAAADAAPGAGQEAVLVWAHVGVAQGHLLVGRADEAALALRRADEVGDSPVATSAATRERARAWLEAARGDLGAARERLAVVAEQVRRDEVLLFEAPLRHDLARFGAPRPAADRLAELAEVVDGPLVQAFALHARGLARGDLALLERSAEAFEAIDSLAFAAEAATELGEAHTRRQDQRAAAAARRWAAVLAAQAGGLGTPPLTRGGGVEPLTAREREVALLAAEGLASRDVGERLGLSTRTVDTHLARVYRKLGIGGRDELAEALRGP